METPESVMITVRVPHRIETGNPQQPFAVEMKEITKMFHLDSTLRVLGDFILRQNTNSCLVVFDNSNRKPLLVPKHVQ